MSVTVDGRNIDGQNVWEDWRGNAYMVGSLVLYPRLDGRSCEIAEGRVLDLYEVYRDEDYKWHKLAAGEEAPLHEVMRWMCIETREVQQLHDELHSERTWVTEPRETERRAKIMPTGRTSRFARWDKKWQWNEETQQGGFVDAEPRPVTLIITKSITVPSP
jgi:hypothetical protein